MTNWMNVNNTCIRKIYYNIYVKSSQIFMKSIFNACVCTCGMVSVLYGNAWLHHINKFEKDKWILIYSFILFSIVLEFYMSNIHVCWVLGAHYYYDFEIKFIIPLFGLLFFPHFFVFWLCSMWGLLLIFAVYCLSVHSNLSIRF